MGQGYTAKGTVDTMGTDNKLVAPHRDHADVDNYLTDTGVVLDQVTEISEGYTHALALRGEYTLDRDNKIIYRGSVATKDTPATANGGHSHL